MQSMIAHGPRCRIAREQLTIDVALLHVVGVHLRLFSSLRRSVSSVHLPQEVLKHGCRSIPILAHDTRLWIVQEYDIHMFLDIYRLMCYANK
jgi:hypothetical protein